MEPIAHLVKVSVPNYLSNLPIPDSIGGWFHLGFKDWAKLVPFGAAVAGFTYMTYKAFCPAAQCKGKLINPDIQKNSAKVVHSVDIEDIGDHAAFCRCWRSRKFPYCDGSHNKLNEATGDNVGPVCVQHKK